MEKENKKMDIDEYLKMLGYLPKIAGIYNATVEDFAKRHKIYKRRFFKKQIKALQTRFKQSLSVFDGFLKGEVTPTIEEPKKKKENKFFAFFKNLVKPKKKDKQAVQEETPPPIKSSEEAPESTATKPKTNETTQPSNSSTESINDAIAKPKTNRKTKVTNTDKKE